MEEFSFADLIELKHTIEEILPSTEDKLLTNSVNENDDEFNFSLKKAINYRDILKKVNDEIEKRLKP